MTCQPLPQHHPSPPPASLHPSVSRGSPPLSTPSSSLSNRRSREMRHLKYWEAKGTQEATEAPVPRKKYQSLTDIMGEGWGRDRQTDRQTKWETHRERAKAESKRKRWDYHLPRPPVHTSNSPLAGAESEMGKKEDLLTRAGKRCTATFL